MKGNILKKTMIAAMLTVGMTASMAYAGSGFSFHITDTNAYSSGNIVKSSGARRAHVK